MLSLPDSTKIRSDGSTLGLYSDTQNNIVAVEFDTFVNDNDPPMLHVGIKNNSLASINYSRFGIERNLGKIDRLYLGFGKEARNLRLGLATSGMNPYGNLSTQHSSWPVLLVIYNFPP